MKDNIIKIELMYYNLDAVISFRVWESSVDLYFGGYNTSVRVKDGEQILKVKKYLGIE